MPTNSFSRRDAARIAMAGAAAAFAGTARAQDAGKPADPAILAQVGPLGDEVLGDANAPVTIIEYASMTCTHCAHFHEATYPQLKAKYIDTGKVKFILREFPLDPLATAGFMLARCAGAGKYYPITDLLFDQQKNWAFVDKPVDALLATVRQAGFTKESFEACLKDQKTFDAVNDVRTRGADKLGVNSTPTFFINGRVERGAIEFDALEKILQPLIK